MPGIQAKFDGGHCPLCSKPMKRGQWITKKSAYNIRENKFTMLWTHSDCHHIPNDKHSSWDLSRAIKHDNPDWVMPSHINMVRDRRPIFLERRPDGSKKHKRMVSFYYNHDTGERLVVGSSGKVCEWTPDHDRNTETGWYEVEDSEKAALKFMDRSF